jgi:hypothetical protein
METPEFLWARVIARSCGVAADGARRDIERAAAEAEAF